MTIAIMSDVHDNIWNLEQALLQLQEYSAETLLFLGDFCAPFSLAQIAEGFSGPVHAVFGNNDGDPFLLGKIASQYSHVTLHGQFAELDLAGKRVAINHYPEISRSLALSDQYDAVFSGHDHKRYQEQFRRTLWANPGEIMGRYGSPSFGIYDSQAGTFLHVDVTSPGAA